MKNNKIILISIVMLVIVISCSPSTKEINEQYKNDKSLSDSALAAQLDSVYEQDEIVKDWEEFWDKTLDVGTDTTMASIFVPPGAKIILKNKKDIVKLKVLINLINKLYQGQGIKLEVKYEQGYGGMYGK